MTYVEFFADTASENVVSCLSFVPDRVVCVGSDKKVLNKHVKKYEMVFGNRNCNIDFKKEVVTKRELSYLVEMISKIVNTYDDCVFDITGGDEMLIFALGIVYSRYPEKNIQVHKINIRNNELYDCDQDGVTIHKETPTLSIEENIGIFGGTIVYGEFDEDNTYKWDMNEDFLNDIDLIWNICKGNARYWNRFAGILELAEELGHLSEDKLTTIASINAINTRLKKYKTEYSRCKGIVNYLLKYGLLTEYEDEEGDYLKVAYKNHQVKRCLVKAGMALEMKVYSLARKAVGKDGVPVYDDALNGVVIDWDGELHDEDKEDVYDTENEIDVLLMHDMVPVFVSCKNGVLDSDELYKLHSVAERFGGEYAKKVLITTSLEKMPDGGKYIRQRAHDMGIYVLDRVQYFSDEEFSRRISHFWHVSG